MNYEGEVRDIKLVERLIELWREKFTGAIRFENDGIIKIIYFKGGDILSASTNDRADSVDEILMRAGKVSKEHVKQALSKRKESETLGDALLNLGFITRKELTWARRIQVINVVRSIEEWQAGSFTVVADYLPKREEGTIFPLPQLVVEMIVTDQDRGKFERALESGTVVFTKAEGYDENFRKLGLNEDAEAIMAQVDGQRAASEVAAASHQETFNAFKLLHALAVLGILEMKKGDAATASLGFESAGVADAADVWGGGGAQFALDDEPAPAVVSSPDDFAPLPGLADPLLAKESPAWDATPAVPAPMQSAPAPDLLHMEPEEDPKWGFDEGLLEAAQKAAEQKSAEQKTVPAMIIPESRPRSTTIGEGTYSKRPAIGETTSTRRPVVTRKKKSSSGWLVGLIAVLALAALGYFGWNWWSAREAGQATAVAETPAVATAPTETVATETEVPTETAQTATIVPVPVPVPVPVSTVPRPPAPAPASTATGDLARYESMAREFATNQAGRFTVQFAIVCEPSNVTKALRGAGGSEVWFAPISIKGRSCFRMYWGRFGTRDEGERALAQLPGELRESRPAVVSIPR